MTYSEFVQEVYNRRLAQLNSDLDANLNGHISGSKLEFHGHCRRVHPDLVEMYPNGWCLSQKETVEESMINLGIEITLTAKQPEQ